MWRRSMVAAALYAALFTACGDSTGPEVVALDVRVHVLRSDFGPLNADLSDAEIAGLFDEVNAIWQQAGIRWTITDIIREAALNEATYAAILEGRLLPSGEALSSILPSGNLTRGRWDVFFAKTLGGLAGGVYLPGVPAVMVAEFDPTGARDLVVSGPRILAHELGHSISLEHVPCTTVGNLMAPGCTTGERTRLTEDQITFALRQARFNRPF